MGEWLGKDGLTLGRTGKCWERSLRRKGSVILVMQKGEKEEGRGEEELEKLRFFFFPRQTEWNARKSSSGPEEE